MNDGKTWPDVIYIMGTARSGTTILEILLTSGSGTQGVGEIAHIFRDGYSGADVCSCGEPVRRCVLWSAVWKSGGWQDSEVPALARLLRDYSWHTRFPLIAAGLVSASSKKRFRETNEKLFGTVAAFSGAGSIVDSSKYAARAIALARYYPGKVRIICLTRSPEGLAQAFARRGTGDQKPKSAIATLLYYCYTTACFRLTRLIIGQDIFTLEYEELRANPAACLRKIAAWSGMSFDKAVQTLAHDGDFHPGHIVTGNRLRHENRIRFVTDADRDEANAQGNALIVKLMHYWRFLLRF